jgi:hypothetical protein
MFYFSKSMQKLQLTWLTGKGDLFQAVPFFNRPKFYGRHIESRSAGITENGFVLFLVL